MTPADLRNSVLQLAIQGRLVEQRPEEGTAEELYLEIIAEKTRLIKKGKLKKEKALPEIKEDEIPFEIPESWKWVRFSEIIDVRDGTHDTPSYTSEGIPLVTSKNLVSGTINFETAKNISHKDADLINARSAVDDGDVLFAMIGTVGNPVLVKKDREFCIKNMALFKPIRKDLFSMKFFSYFLLYEQRIMKTKASGGIQRFVSLKFLRSYLLPLPPLSEQKRIVSRLETLLPYIDRYGEAWSRLEECNERFPVDLQKSLLQSAIQGRLVEQRQEEGTGEELYHEILAEKSRLIKEGKIKKEKALPEIKDDEIPSEIPESWKWVRLGSCTTYNQTKEKVKGTEISPETWSLDLEDIEKETGRVLERVFAKSRKISGERVVFHKGEILYSKLRPYLKKILVADADGVCSSEMVPFHSYGKMLHEYLAYVLKSPYADFTVNSATYGMKMPRVGTETMLNLLIPLPPLAEQKRIVAKLEELLPLCERLTQNNS